MASQWLARGLTAAVLASSMAIGASGAMANAQELDGCTGTGPSCRRIEEFNFSDPVLARESRYLLRGERVYVSYSNMAMVAIPTEQSSEDSARASARPSFPNRGDYPGASGRELYCIVFARGC